MLAASSTIVSETSDIQSSTTMVQWMSPTGFQLAIFPRPMAKQKHLPFLNLQPRLPRQVSFHCFSESTIGEAQQEALTWKLEDVRPKVEAKDVPKDGIEVTKAALKSMGDGEISLSAYNTAWIALIKMVDALMAVALPVLLHFLPRAKKPGQLPPGSLGLPLIGQSLAFLRALHTNTGERWIRDRIRRYGPVSKMSLFGTPTVLLTGPAGNKFIFFSPAVASEQARSAQMILGEKSILELNGADHKRIRGALHEFLKPDMLRLYVGKIDGEVRRHLDECWADRRTVTVMPLMKRVTFDIISLLLFGLERSPLQEALAGEFEHLMEGMLSIPVNLPFTAFSQSLKASARARRMITGILRETRAKLERGEASRSSDLIACLLSLTDHSGVPLLSEEEIVDNSMVTLIAGHDTSSVLMTFMMRHLANDPNTLATMVQEHDMIAKNKGDGEALDWDDLAKMKYTWSVALETLRMVPPVFGNFRRVIQDVEFDGYLIPKGWKVFWVSSETHMDADIFPEPTKFDPSRFENQSAAAAPPCSFVGFGGGPKICVGMEFARIETLVMMHYLVRRFSWKLCCKNDTITWDTMPSPLHGLPIELEQKGLQL